MICVVVLFEFNQFQSKKDDRVNPSDFNNAAILNANKKRNVQIVELIQADPRFDPNAGGVAIKINTKQ